MRHCMFFHKNNLIIHHNLIRKNRQSIKLVNSNHFVILCPA